MTIHELKILPEYYDAVLEGRKTFEIRKNDRGFAVGDTLVLKEWNQMNRMPTGREQRCEITYILEGNDETKEYGLMKGFCIMSIMQIVRPINLMNRLKINLTEFTA